MPTDETRVGTFVHVAPEGSRAPEVVARGREPGRVVVEHVSRRTSHIAPLLDGPDENGSLVVLTDSGHLGKLEQVANWLLCVLRVRSRIELVEVFDHQSLQLAQPPIGHAVRVVVCVHAFPRIPFFGARAIARPLLEETVAQVAR